jgi:predicted nucleic acid-binding protein
VPRNLNLQLEAEIWDRDKIIEDEEEVRAREIRIQKRIAQEKAERASKGIIDDTEDDSALM